MNKDTEFMNRAIELAKTAGKMGEIPVGAVVVCDGEVVGEGYNTRESSKNALAHAEITAINNACKKLGGWRLHKCELYVTLEPCPMCAGAIINSRIKRVVFGATDTKAGAFGTVMNLNEFPLNHKAELSPGECKNECSALLSDFFTELRKKKKA